MIANLEPGIHNLSAEVYHADPCVKPSLSSSIANVLLQQSPLHAWMAQNPQRALRDVHRLVADTLEIIVDA